MTVSAENDCAWPTAACAPTPISTRVRPTTGAGDRALRYGPWMDPTELRAIQAPLKALYKENPSAAVVTLKATGRVGEEAIVCSVQTGRALVEAGLHPASGGDGLSLCSGDMLLEALVACAGVTLKAVATALGIAVREGTVRAEGDLDFRGTLGVAKDAPVGFAAIRLEFSLDTDATPEQLEKLISLTERYCVVYQTLRTPPKVTITHATAVPP